MDNTPEYYKIVFSLANETYKELHQKGIRNTAICPDANNASTMIFDPTHPSSNNRCCWNCGETDCNVINCPKPKDLVWIAANQKLFYQNKKGNDSKSTDFTPSPKETKLIPRAWRAPEPCKDNNRVIFRNPYTCNPFKLGWDEDETPPRAAAKPIHLDTLPNSIVWLMRLVETGVASMDYDSTDPSI